MVFHSRLKHIKILFYLLLATAASIGIAAGMQGHFLRSTKYYERIMLLAGSFMIILANYIVNLAGLALIGVVLASQILFKKQEAAVLEE